MEYYERYFNTYLSILKKDYKDGKSLSDLIKSCKASYWELIGMLNLLRTMGEISNEIEEQEKCRVVDEFSSIKLFNAYEENGDIMVFSK